MNVSLDFQGKKIFVHTSAPLNGTLGFVPNLPRPLVQSGEMKIT